MSTSRTQPNQTHAPLPDYVVIAMEQVAASIVEEKLVQRRDHVNLEATLAGEIDGKFDVEVRCDSGIMDVTKPIMTKLGMAHIESIYPSKAGEIAVGIRFYREEVMENVKEDTNDET